MGTPCLLQAGADTNADWLYNVKAHPDATIDVGTDSIRVRVRIAEGTEHDRIWEQQKTN